MKAEKLFKILFVMCLLALPASLISCSSDDDSSSDTTITGLWELEGSTATSYLRFYFGKNGSGYMETEAGTDNFTYTYSYNGTTGNATLKLNFTGESTVTNFTVTRTGNSLYLQNSDGVIILKRR